MARRDHDDGVGENADRYGRHTGENVAEKSYEIREASTAEQREIYAGEHADWNGGDARHDDDLDGTDHGVGNAAARNSGRRGELGEEPPIDGAGTPPDNVDDDNGEQARREPGAQPADEQHGGAPCLARPQRHARAPFSFAVTLHTSKRAMTFTAILRMKSSEPTPMSTATYCCPVASVNSLASTAAIV